MCLLFFCFLFCMVGHRLAAISPVEYVPTQWYDIVKAITLTWFFWVFIGKIMSLGIFLGCRLRCTQGARTHTPHACAHTRGLPHLICAPLYRSFTIKRFVICNDYVEVKGTVFMNVTHNIYLFYLSIPIQDTIEKLYK